MSALPQEFVEGLENSKAEYVRLGNSGLRVSVPILGAMSIGSSEWLPWILDEDKVRLSPGPSIAVDDRSISNPTSRRGRRIPHLR